MEKTIIVSNRLPITIKKSENGTLAFSSSVGGLATGLSSVFASEESVWIGSPGIFPNGEEEQTEIATRLNEKKMSPVFVDEAEYEKFYAGMSNDTFWPLFHYFVKLTSFSEENWAAYESVNQAFANEVVKFLKKGDTIWIHDYHLFLLPKLIKERFPEVSIGFFLHIPFPSYEVFRLLPWREEILRGVLGSDLIGFHTYDDVRHFLSSTSRICGVSSNNGIVETETNIVKVEAFPMGIDYNKFYNMAISSHIKQKIVDIKKTIGSSKLILSVDRLDISKGIPEKLKSYEMFLEKNKEYIGKCILILIVVPSRTEVKNYKDLKAEIEKEVGRINGKYGKLDWMPIYYNYRQFQEDYLIALYKISDIALVTPLRDGMNLVAKEYIASQSNKEGVLILSEMAGASKELSDAIIINPYDYNSIAESIKTALEMPLEEQRSRLLSMQVRLRRNDINKWSSSFLSKLDEVKQYQKDVNINTKQIIDIESFAQELLKYKTKVLLLDYDGTLVSIQSSPLKASPDAEVIEILQKLSQNEHIHLVVVTGRNKELIGEWLKPIKKLNIIAEHGMWLKEANKDWVALAEADASWKSQLLPVLQNFTDITPGTEIEEKDYSLVWHYRKADPDFGMQRARELVSNLDLFTKNKDLQVLEGKKVIEIKPVSFNKGIAVKSYLKNIKYNISIAFGDDITDEDLFKQLTKKAINIKVGEAKTSAHYKINSFKEVRRILKMLV